MEDLDLAIIVVGVAFAIAWVIVTAIENMRYEPPRD